MHNFHLKSNEIRIFCTSSCLNLVPVAKNKAKKECIFVFCFYCHYVPHSLPQTISRGHSYFLLLTEPDVKILQEIWSSPISTLVQKWHKKCAKMQLLGDVQTLQNVVLKTGVPSECFINSCIISQFQCGRGESRDTLSQEVA